MVRPTAQGRGSVVRLASVTRAASVAHLASVTSLASVARLASVVRSVPWLLGLLGASASSSLGRDLPDPRADGLWIHRPLARVEVAGIRETRPFVVLRELQTRPGEPIRWDRVERDRLRLLDLALFAEVAPSVRRDPESGRPVLVFAIRERPHVLAYPILQYDPDEGWSYGAYLSHQNFRGRAERAAVLGTLGDRRSFSVGYSVPWILGRRIGVGGNAFYRDVKKPTEEIRDQRRGFGLSVAPALSYELRTSFSGGAEEVRTSPLHPDGPARETRDHRWAGIVAQLDTRDTRFRSLEGGLWRAGVTGHGGVLGGTEDLMRVNADVLRVVPTGAGTALTAASRILWSEGPVPSYLRVNLGGIDTLRGHPQGAYGGESRWIGWIEERIPVLPTRRISLWKDRYVFDYTVDATAFVDAGSVWDGDDLIDGRARARFGCGVGLRIVLPLLQALRFDVATDGRAVRAYGAGGLRL
jgi:outer membrane protein assembly factor BamA